MVNELTYKIRGWEKVNSENRLRNRFLGYIALTCLLTLFEFMTAGQYRKWVILCGIIGGWCYGLGMEVLLRNLKNEIEVYNIGLISRSVLYVVPLVFSDSLLLFVNAIRSNSIWLLFSALYMVVMQVGVIWYLSSSLELRKLNGKPPYRE